MCLCKAEHPESNRDTKHLPLMICSNDIRKRRPSDVLNLPILRLHRFRSDVVSLILILWFRLLSYAIKFVQILLPVLLFLLFLAHAITSGIVCTKDKDYIRKKALIQIFYYILNKPVLFCNISIHSALLFSPNKYFSKSFNNVYVSIIRLPYFLAKSTCFS